MKGDKFICKNPSVVWWGCEFEEGKEYEIMSTGEVEISYVSDTDLNKQLDKELLEPLNFISEIVRKYNGMPPEDSEDIIALKRVNDRFREIRKRKKDCFSKVTVPTVSLNNELGEYSNNSTFISISREEICSRLNIDEIEFNGTIYFFDYFFEV